MSIEKLLIEKFPIIENNRIITKYCIDVDEEISIIINNKEILDKTNIKTIENNVMFLQRKLKKTDDIVIVYYKI